MLPDYSKQDIVRLFSMTGGILPILNELDEHDSLEDNLRRLLRFDSAFSRFLPEWLGEYCRTPESYYPILTSLANRRHRLSEIAQDIGFPNNKCKTYLRTLIRAGLVEQDHPMGRTWSTYHLTNSYIAAWCQYVYRNRSRQIMDPDGILQQVTDSIDHNLALPAFHRACFRYLDMGTKDYLFKYRYPEASEIRRNVTYTFTDGRRVTLTYCVLQMEHSMVAVMAESLDTKYTKDDVQRIRAAVARMNTLYGTDIVLFSLNRFSDWCVHEASREELLHLVTVERLKY